MDSTFPPKRRSLPPPRFSNISKARHRDEPNPFAEHQALCERGLDVADDVIYSFWEAPLGFAFLVHNRYNDEMTDLLAGRVYNEAPLAALHALREMNRAPRAR